MRVFQLSLLMCLSLSVSAQSLAPKKVNIVTFKGILSGAYHDYLSENKEYQDRSERYEYVVSQYNVSKLLIQDFEKNIQRPEVTPYFRERAQQIALLVKNEETGDVYKQIRKYGIDFVLVLNDIFPIVQLYECERVIVSSEKELAELESWAKSMAAISEYFKHLFLERKLNQPLSYYTKVQSYDRQIDLAYKNFLENGNRLDEGKPLHYEKIYSNWQSHLEELRLKKGRKSFFNTLEKKYGNTIKQLETVE